MEKITDLIVNYPEGQNPTFTIPTTYNSNYRFALGKIDKTTKNPLLAICMNPSAASEETSDRTVNRVIDAAQKLGHDGWIITNLYPERSTDIADADDFDDELNKKNISEIKKIIRKYKIKEVWGAWGNPKHNDLLRSLPDLKEMLKGEKVKVFYYRLNKSGNPTHPLYLKIVKDNKGYLKL